MLVHALTRECDSKVVRIHSQTFVAHPDFRSAPQSLATRNTIQEGVLAPLQSHSNAYPSTAVHASAHAFTVVASVRVVPEMKKYKNSLRLRLTYKHGY